MLRKTRITAALIVFSLLTLVFLDFTGTLHLYFSWLAKVQFVPALLAHSLAVLIILTLVTLFFGRIYCSIICPLGVMQDGISNVSGKRRGKENRFGFSKAKTSLRYGVLAVFIVALVAHASIVASLLDPYAAWGRITTHLFAPLYRLGNNLLAWFAKTVDSYAFYSTEVFITSGIALGVAIITLLVVGVLAWRHGRTYCNTICPVGTMLGFISRFSFFRPTHNPEKCTKCRLCEKGCKGSCLDSAAMSIDGSRCVSCFNCIENCKSGGVKYSRGFSRKKATRSEIETVPSNGSDAARRSFVAVASTFAISQALRGQQLLQADGGLAEIKDKKNPLRETPVVPPGSSGLPNLKRYCTACHLCVSACPNKILRPSRRGSMLMQPEMFFEKDYCRPECTECSQVCPSGAISRITPPQKTAISIGRVIWNKENCIINRDNVQCRSCERHCPTDAITLVERDPGTKNSLKIPVINNAKCNGCGACEYYCPARPLSAIYVEGNVRHHTI